MQFGRSHGLVGLKPADDGGETFINNEYCFVENEDGTRDWKEGTWELVKESQEKYYTNALNTFSCKFEREHSYQIYLLMKGLP